MNRTDQFGSIITLLNIDNTLSINRLLSHAIGLKEAVMYQALIAKYVYYKKNNLLSNDGWFYSTISDLQESTTLTGKAQRRVCENLCNFNLIEKKLEGMPRKTYYRIVENCDLLLNILEQGETKSANLKSQNNKKSAEKPSNNHSSAQRAQQEVVKGYNKMCPKGTTSSAQREHKTKDNKTKDNKVYFLTNHSFDSNVSTTTDSERENNRMSERMIRLRAELIVDYDYLLKAYPQYSELTEAIIKIIVQVLACKQEYISFGKSNNYRTDVFKTHIKSLNEEMIADIFDNFENLENKITSPIPYLAAVLYNEPVQFDVRVAEFLRDARYEC